MEQYIITYYIDNDLSVKQLVEAESRESALESVKALDEVNFTDSKNVLYDFKMRDVKLITVHKYIAATVRGFR